MAFLKPIKTKTELNSMNNTQLKVTYLETVEDYQKILDHRYVYCPFCGNYLAKGNFYTSTRTVDGIEHFACKKCLLKMATDWKQNEEIFYDNKTKTIEILHILDLPFIEDLYESYMDEKNYSIDEEFTTVFQRYMGTIKSLPQYRGLTWKDTVFEKIIDNTRNNVVRDETITLFGTGFTEEDYLYLQAQYDDWKLRTSIDSKSQEIYIVRICFKLLDIWKAQKKGKDTKELDKSLNDLMNAANLQPRQNNLLDSNDSLTFGQLIQRWENERPIPEPDPEFKDVDNIKTYIDVFFKGHLAKMVGLKNGFSQFYEDYIAKYTVKPVNNVDENGQNEIYNQLFGKQEE